MEPAQPPILDYATPPRQPSGFASLPVWVIVLVAALVPGLGSLLIRRRTFRFLGRLAVIPAAFVFFGPFWGEVLFRSTRLQELGLWPFLATCAATCAESICSALRNRKEALQG